MFLLCFKLLPQNYIVHLWEKSIIVLYVITAVVIGDSIISMLNQLNCLTGTLLLQTRMPTKRIRGAPAWCWVQIAERSCEEMRKDQPSVQMRRGGGKDRERERERERRRCRNECRPPTAWPFIFQHPCSSFCFRSRPRCPAPKSHNLAGGSSVIKQTKTWFCLNTHTHSDSHPPTYTCTHTHTQSHANMLNHIQVRSHPDSKDCSNSRRVQMPKWLTVTVIRVDMKSLCKGLGVPTSGCFMSKLLTYFTASNFKGLVAPESGTAKFICAS